MSSKAASSAITHSLWQGPPSVVGGGWRRERALERRQAQIWRVRGYIELIISPVRFGFVFSHLMFSTTWPGLFWVCFFHRCDSKGLPGFVFGFVWVCFLLQSFIINNFSALFFKNNIVFLFHLSLLFPKRRRQALKGDYHARPPVVKQNRCPGGRTLRSDKEAAGRERWLQPLKSAPSASGAESPESAGREMSELKLRPPKEPCPCPCMARWGLPNLRGKAPTP